MAMIICKWCIEEFDESVAICPHCQTSQDETSENKPPNLLKLYCLGFFYAIALFLIICFLIGVYLGAFSIEDKNGKIIEGLTGPALIISIALSIFLVRKGLLPGTKK